MWMEITKTGKYQFREGYTDPLTGKYKTVSVTYARTNRRIEKEAFLHLQEKIEERLNESSKEITFKQLSGKWLKVFEKQVKTSTYFNNVTYMKIINREIGGILLPKLSAVHINNVILQLFEKDYKYDTVKGLVGSIRNALRFGIEYGYLRNNEILDGIVIPRINLPDKNKKKKYKYLERHELKSVIDQLTEAKYDEIARMCMLQVQTGMRHGELISIDYTKHIDFDERIILIERTWYHRRRIFQTPKSGHSRKIHFNEQTEKLLKEQIQFSRLKVLSKGLDSKNRLLFTNLKNEPFNNSYTNEILGKFVHVKNKDITTHIFRHTFIAYMLEANVNLKLIAEHVGHSKIDMIQEFYDHFTEEMNKQLKDTINSFSINF